MKNNLVNSYYYLFIFFLFYLTVLLGLFFNEDNLGGAMNDAIIHFEISKKFNINFSQTFLLFGTHESGLSTRNSPVFWIFLSFLNKCFSYEIIRILNTTLIFLIAIIFYKSLLLKFKNIDSKTLIFLSSFIFLSPSLRSLAIWPYSLIWGLFFFVISIYYYLKFINHLNFYRSAIILFNIIVASYVYPSFSVFYIFYLLEIFQKIKNKKDVLGLLFLSFFLSIPCLLYIISNNFFSAYQNSQGVDSLSFLNSLNISNKILIISSMFLYFILPIINIKDVYVKIKTQSSKNIAILILFCVINFYFFNFPNSVWGGGFFHKISYLIFDNNYLFFLCSFLSIFVIYIISEKKFKNYLILLILILFNPQFTIYVKYFDPLIFIIFLTLFNFDLKNHFIKKSFKFYQFYGVILFYYFVIYAKKIFV